MKNLSIKSLVKRYIYKEGSIVKIIRGPLRGYKYKVNQYSGWSHIVARWEPRAQQVYQKLILRGQVVYDLGANVGMHSLLFSKIVGPGGKIFSFEPVRENIDSIRLLKNLNGISNIEVIDKAISDSVGTVDFNLGKHATQGSLIGIGCETGEKITVGVSTLDALIAEGLPLPDFIKMDIEGAEGAALKGFSGNIEKCFPIFSIDLHNPEQDSLVGKFLKFYQYQLFRLNQHKSHWGPVVSKIRILDEGWPNPNGVWGTVIAMNSKRQILL